MTERTEEETRKCPECRSKARKIGESGWEEDLTSGMSRRYAYYQCDNCGHKWEEVIDVA